ncbi:MAG: hypothetical protein HY458_00725 [Parcubacteria group bacterium]|nr:hypothetical protein [Parcubacteria group bacterium]
MDKEEFEEKKKDLV